MICDVIASSFAHHRGAPSSDPTCTDRYPVAFSARTEHEVDQTGGAVEHDESPHTAATREIAEELGIHRTPGWLLALDYVPADPARGRTEGMIVVFDGGTITDPTILRLPPDELSDHAFVEPAQLHRYLPALQTRRAIAALHASATGHTAYLENGHQP